MSLNSIDKNLDCNPDAFPFLKLAIEAENEREETIRKWKEDPTLVDPLDTEECSRKTKALQEKFLEDCKKDDKCDRCCTNKAQKIFKKTSAQYSGYYKLYINKYCLNCYNDVNSNPYLE